MRLLNNFKNISIVHTENDVDWEPFDIHNRGPMPLWNLERCLNMVYSQQPVDVDKINRIYTLTASKPLIDFNRNAAIGFKMRFTTPGVDSPFRDSLPKNFTFESYKTMMLDVLKKNNVTVFMAVRQDILKWALSKYHGDGRFTSGHIQFKLAKGEINRNDIGKFRVDCTQLEEIIKQCIEGHSRKRLRIEEFNTAGIKTYPLLYEDFIQDKHSYLERFLDILKIDYTNEDIVDALAAGTFFEKVHSDNISDFVENHEEVLERFSNYYDVWV